MAEAHTYSQQQLAIFDWFARTHPFSDGHLIVRARAGTGKTFTITEAVKRAPERRILLAAFNTRIADELRRRFPDSPHITVKTLHGVGNLCLSRYWPRLRIQAYGRDSRGVQLTEAVCGLRVPAQLKRLVTNLHTKAREMYPLAESHLDLLPIAEQFDLEPDESWERIGFDTDRIARYAFDAMLLAAEKIPTCIDFADQIYLPIRNRWLHAEFDLGVVDETQDLAAAQLILFRGVCAGRMALIGDDRQCVDVNTSIDTPYGPRQARTIVVGDKVLALRNGCVTPQVVTATASSTWTFGYRITTSSGRSLLMSPNHRIWASSPRIPSGGALVYLMYRRDLGFRVGITNKCEDSYNPYGHRTHVERAERLWILHACADRNEALFLEVQCSLFYGIPTSIFEGVSRNIDQGRLDRIFSAFGQNGYKLLADRHLSFEHPNWISTSYTKLGKLRRTIQFIGHAAKGSQVALEWSGDDLDEALHGLDVIVERLGNDRRRLRKFCMNYGDAATFAAELQQRTGASLRERLASDDGEPLSLLTASALLPYMSVVVKEHGDVAREEILSVTKERGEFLDLEVSDAANFFGNGILSHNSVYSFRGADSGSIDRIKAELNAVELGLTQTFRCGKAIVDLAKTLVPDYEAHPGNPLGVIERMDGYDTMVARAEPGDFILSRKNAPLAGVAMALLRAGKSTLIAGKTDIGASLLSLTDQLAKGEAAFAVPAFLDRLQDWRDRQIARARKAEDEAKEERAIDTAETLNVLAEHAVTVAEIRQRLNDLFPFKDQHPSTVVTCSSVHKAKGLEADRVFVLVDTMQSRPFGGKPQSPMAALEELNIKYVAWTRARSTLVLVTSKAPATPRPSALPLTSEPAKLLMREPEPVATLPPLPSAVVPLPLEQPASDDYDRLITGVGPQQADHTPACAASISRLDWRCICGLIVYDECTIRMNE